mmetsp:Transcript_16942/g.59265  ORF Transcript_16942/g.59265 Transcript_16942/m.59265 type:complete len:357 (-) Transcript_16942:235-1305(-)
MRSKVAVPHFGIECTKRAFRDGKCRRPSRVHGGADVVRERISVVDLPRNQIVRRHRCVFFSATQRHGCWSALASKLSFISNRRRGVVVALALGVEHVEERCATRAAAEIPQLRFVVAVQVTATHTGKRADEVSTGAVVVVAEPRRHLGHGRRRQHHLVRRLALSRHRATPSMRCCSSCRPHDDASPQGASNESAEKRSKDEGVSAGARRGGPRCCCCCRCRLRRGEGAIAAKAPWHPVTHPISAAHHHCTTQQETARRSAPEADGGPATAWRPRGQGGARPRPAPPRRRCTRQHSTGGMKGAPHRPTQERTARAAASAIAGPAAAAGGDGVSQRRHAIARRASPSSHRSGRPRVTP